MLASELHAQSLERPARTGRVSGIEPDEALARHRDRLAVRAEIAPGRGLVLGLILGIAMWSLIISISVTFYHLV
jgi:hypothetical protein